MGNAKLDMAIFDAHTPDDPINELGQMHDEVVAH